MMTKKKIDHVGFRNESLFCSNCGGSQKMPIPIAIPVFTAMARAFEKLHADCLKTWKEPEADQSLSISQKAAWWFAYGERGVSSEAMHAVLSGGGPVRGASHPWDPDDFRRCYMLLKAVPEWKVRLPLLKQQSKAWSNLVDNWDKLTEMLEDLLAGRKNGMSAFMNDLIGN